MTPGVKILSLKPLEWFLINALCWKIAKHALSMFRCLYYKISDHFATSYCLKLCLYYSLCFSRCVSTCSLKLLQNTQQKKNFIQGEWGTKKFINNVFVDIVAGSYVIKIMFICQTLRSPRFPKLLSDESTR